MNPRLWLIFDLPEYQFILNWHKAWGCFFSLSDISRFQPITAPDAFSFLFFLSLWKADGGKKECWWFITSFRMIYESDTFTECFGATKTGFKCYLKKGFLFKPKFSLISVLVRSAFTSLPNPQYWSLSFFVLYVTGNNEGTL